MGRDHDRYDQGVRMNDILEAANRSEASNKIIILTGYLDDEKVAQTILSGVTE